MPDDIYWNIFGAHKRKRGESDEPKAKKQDPPGSKNALTTLEEYKRSPTYNLISRTGPEHATIFVIAVEIDGQTFQGQGTSKKSARRDAAQNACRALNIPFALQSA